MEAEDKLADALKAADDQKTDEERQAEEDRMKEMAADGKALKTALGVSPLGNLVSIEAADPLPAIPSLTPTGLMLGTPGRDASGAIDESTPSRTPRMPTGDSAGMLGDWGGTNYSHTNPSTEVSNSAVVYTNQAEPTVKPFATGASYDSDTTDEPADNATDFRLAYSPTTRTLSFRNNDGGELTDVFVAPAALDVAGDMFPTAGEQTYLADTLTGAVVIAGTYQGAPGSYRCAGNACMAEAGAAGGVTLGGGTWVFVHDMDAMTAKVDGNYLYFGWWLMKDDDGIPTSASAFTGTVGTFEALAANPSSLSGSATYAGQAAGKFAISGTTDGAGDAGHFTAAAMLTATFGPNEAPNFGV